MARTVYLGVTAILAGVLLAGCQGNPPRGEGPVEDVDRFIQEGLEAHQRAVETPREVESALLPPVVVAPAPAAAEPRFDLQVSDLPAREFFMGLVDSTPYNMVVHPQVSGNITLNLKGVSIPEAMAIARDVYGYEFERTAYGFQVLPVRLRSRIYRVDYLNVLRSGTSQTRVSSGQISQSGRSTSASGDDTDTPAGSVTGTEINTVQPETSFWSELRASIAAILGGAEGRSVVVNPQSGVVVVRAMPQELREIEAYLEATQAITARQVILEAKILEVELSDGFQSGINWSALVELGGGRTATAAQVGGGSVLGDLNNPTGFAPVTAASAASFGGVFSLALNLNSVTAFIELLETQGNVQVLSSPRVSTLNNQKAVIKVGSDEFFVTDISSTTVTGTTTTTTPSVELTPFFSGIALDVTPQISAEGDVTLHVHPSVSEVVDQQKSITVGNTTQNIPLALSTVRESDSIVRARSGQVVVIGGLMRNQRRDEQAAPPLLGALPMFRHSRESASKTELVILLRPLVVEDSGAWAESLGDTGRRFRRLREGMGHQAE